MAARGLWFNDGWAVAMRGVLAGVALMLSGCGGGGGHFAPGTWQLDAWMESAAGSARDIPGAHQKDTVKLTPQDASMPPASVFATRFYHGLGQGDLRFENGRVEGRFHQNAVDDISAHDVPIAGTYGRDRFHVTFEYQAFGMKVRQTVEGKIVDPSN